MVGTMITMGTSATTKVSTLPDLHQDCFACGAGNPSGLHLQFEVDANGVASVDWQPSLTFMSYPDRVHGGMIATLLDSSMVHALFARGVAGVTAELTIRFLHGVNVIEPVHICGWLEYARRGIYLCRAEVHQGGVLAVRATAKFMAMPDPPSGS